MPPNESRSPRNEYAAIIVCSAINMVGHEWIPKKCQIKMLFYSISLPEVQR